MTLSRRDFLTVGGSAVVFLAGGARVSSAADGRLIGEGLFTPWIAITASNRVVVLVDKCEMGQGIRDLFARIVAQALNVAPETILVDDAPVGREYKNTKFPLPVFQVTGYSSSTADVAGKLERAARETASALRRAAGARLAVFPSRLTLKDGWVIATGHPDRKLTYAAAAGSTLEVKPRRRGRCEPTVTPAPFSPTKRVDAREKVTGCARFGIDVDETELGEKPLVALMLRPDRPGDQVELSAEALAELARLFPDVRALPLRDRQGIALVAPSFWRAYRAQQHARASVRQVAVPIDPMWADSDKTLAAFASAALADGPARDDGRSIVVDRVYRTPYGPHAPLEPMTASCRRQDSVYHVWAATQFPPGARGLVVAALKRDGDTSVRPDRVVIHGMLAGGSFGRRTNSDFIVEAARVCRELDGRAVKLIWTRDEDFRHDYLRPCAVNRVTARLRDGRITEWTQRVAARSPNWAMLPDYTAAAVPSVLAAAQKVIGEGRQIVKSDGVDPTYAEGISPTAYDFRPSTRRVREPASEHPWRPRVGYWRSVNFFHTVFAAESTLDDLAAAGKLNPVDFRLGMLGQSPRLAWCLEQVAPAATRARFATSLQGPPPTGGVGHGVACFSGFKSFAALAVEIRVEAPVRGRPEIQVTRATAAVDCGRLMSPDVVRQQVEGGIVFGLSAALKQDLNLLGGVVQPRNFDECDLLRMHECPDIIVHCRTDSPGATPTGVGELIVPLVAPAVANAVFNLTRQRLVRLPLVPGEARA